MVDPPSSPWEVDLAPDEWAAYLLLRDKDLLNARDAEQAANFYNPKTRTLAPEGDPVFESKVAAARLRRQKNFQQMLHFREMKFRLPTLDDLGFVEAYSAFDGEEEFELDRICVLWQEAEMAHHNARKDGISEVINEDGEKRWRKADEFDLIPLDSEIQLMRHEAEQAWNAWRAKLSVYVNRIRLASLIVARRNETGLSQEQFATYAQVSGSTIKNFENVDQPGKWFSISTIERMESALGWEPGSVTAVLRGGEPVCLPTWEGMGLSLKTPSLPYGGQVSGFTQTAGVVQGESDSRINVRLDTDSTELLRDLAVAEVRSINAVLADAVAFYAKHHLNKETS